MKTYTLELTEAGLGYVRLALGRMPHDEVRQMIDSVEFQKAQQDKPQAVAGGAHDEAQGKVRMGNGSAQQHDAPAVRN